MNEGLLLALLVLACVVGLCMIPFGLPGTWLIVVGSALFGWFDHWQRYQWTACLVLIAAATVGEVLEQLITAKGAARYGASRAGAWGAFLGSFVGALLGVPIPVPLLGSVVGAFVGAFAGAVLAELASRRTTKEAVTAGWGALLGRALATAFKLGLAMAMAAGLLLAVLR